MKKSYFVIATITMSLLSVLIINCSVKVDGAMAAEKVYNWRLQAYDAGPTPGFTALEQFANEVNEKSKGSLNIKVFRAGTFGYSGFELHRIVSKGLIELAEPLDLSLTLEDPVAGINLLPFLFSNNNEVLKGWPVSKKHIFAYLEKINCHPLLAYERPMNYLYVKGKKVKTIEDWKGLKLRTWSAMTSALIEALGGTALQIPYSEVYTAMASGIIQGNIASPQSATDQKCYEVANYYCLWPISPIVYALVVNKPLYESLPKDLRNILDEASKKYEPVLWTNNFHNVDDAIKGLVQKGMELVPVEQGEIKKAQEIMGRTYWQKWSKETGERGRIALEEMNKAIGR